MNVKVRKLIFLSFALSLGTYTRAVDPASPGNPGERGRPRAHRQETLDEYLVFDKIRTGPHKIDVVPMKLSEGIKTGLVMVYGHIISPPFKVERDGNRIFVNGIRVQPSLVRERQERARKGPDLSHEQNELNKKIGLVYREAYKVYAESPSSAGKKIQDMMAQQPDIFKNVQWHESGANICFVSPRSKVQECWGLKPWDGPSKQELASNQVKIAEESKSSIERHLREGKFVVFDSRGQFGPTRDFRAAARAILRDKSLTRTQKIEKVKEVVEDYGLALDVVDNYSEAEWSREK